MKHKHRIKPGYEGGEYVEGNVVVLSPTQHAMWHFAEWQRKGNWEDKLAWRVLSGTVGREEADLESRRQGGITMSSIHRENGAYFFDSQWQSEQGRKGAAKTKELGVGICNPEIAAAGRAKCHQSGQPQRLGQKQGPINVQNGTLERARKNSPINKDKYECLVTGKVTTAGPLTAYQKARGIDPKLRKKID